MNVFQCLLEFFNVKLFIGMLSDFCCWSSKRANKYDQFFPVYFHVLAQVTRLPSCSHLASLFCGMVRFSVTSLSYAVLLGVFDLQKVS